MNSVASILLALLMFLTPVSSAIDVDSVEVDPATVTIEQNGESMTFGASETAEGAPVFYFASDDGSIYLTGDKSYIVSPEGVAYTPSQELAALLGSLIGMIPDPTEEDLQAMGMFALTLMADVNPDAFSFAPAGNGFTLKLDAALLLSELDRAMPAALRSCAGVMDPVVRKYTAAFGHTMDCAELAEAWPEMGLSAIETSLKLQLTVVPKEDGSIAFLGKIAEATFIGNAYERGFSVRVSVDGKVYEIDTDDLEEFTNYLILLAYGLLENSLVVTEEGDTRVATLPVNTTTLAQQLNAILANDVSENRETVNAMLNKYRGWLELLDPELGAVLTADHLILAFSNGAITLPEMKGEFVMKQLPNGTLTADGLIIGELGSYKVTGDVVVYDANSFSSSVRYVIDDGEGKPFMYTINSSSTYSEDGASTTATYTFSEPVCGLFRTLSFSADSYSCYNFYGMTEDEYLEMLNEDYDWYSDFYNEVYGSYYGYINAMYEYAYVENSIVSITTDTDAFRFYADSAKPVIDLKTPEFNFHLATNEADEGTLLLETPEFALNLLSTDSGISINSSTFGFSADSYGLDGYIAEGYERTRFGIHTDDNGHVYFSDGYDSYTLTFAGNEALLVADDETYRLYSDSENGQLLVSQDNTVIYTVTTQQSADYTANIYRIYAGTDVTAEPLCTITADADPDEVTLPAFGALVDAEDFIELLESIAD